MTDTMKKHLKQISNYVNYAGNKCFNFACMFERMKDGYGVAYDSYVKYYMDEVFFKCGICIY